MKAKDTSIYQALNTDFDVFFSLVVYRETSNYEYLQKKRVIKNNLTNPIIFT